ncbi:MAG: NnrS family protein, partial [Bacillota bacterium]
MNTTHVDGYRYFFPAGWVLGIWGVLLWILFPWNLVSYPGLHHPEVMTGGFFLCFVCGFLMTAAPKFTSSFGPTQNEQRIAFGLIAALFLSLAPQSKVYFYGAVAALFIFLTSFLLRRFRNRKSNPPDSFLFVGFGVISGLVGCLLLFGAEFGNLPTPLYNFGRLLSLQGYVLCLVMGVGSRLIPALLGWGPLPNQTASNPVQPKIKLFAVLAILFVFSYVFEAASLVFFAQLLRSFVMSYIVFQFWKIHKLPQRRAFQSWWLWASAWFMLLGQWATVLLPDYRIHLLHVILVSGLGLMTLMIAVRVSLSHGG